MWRGYQSLSMQRVKKPFRKASRKLTRSASEKIGKQYDDDIASESQAYESQPFGTLSPPSLDNGVLDGKRSSTKTSFHPPENIRFEDSDTADQIKKVQNLERMIRQFIIVFAAFILGSRRPEWAALASNMLGYIVTAWATCFVILYILDTKKKERTLSRDIQAEAHSVGELEPLLSPMTTTPTQRLQPPPSIVPAESITESLPEISASSSLDVMDDHQHAHPSLSSLFIMDTNSGRRMDTNGKVTHISNEWIEMDVLAMIRTPDVDDPTAPMGTAGNTKISEYFRGRQRRFEFQFQFKLKKPVAGKNIYFAAELENPVKLGIVQRAFVGAAMAFMRKTNPSFHYSIAGTPDNGDGAWEKPHMAFTVLGSMDRLVISKPGEDLPELGSELYEDPEAIKNRKRGVDVDWNCEDTYTCALWSAYCDWIDWKIINLPGIRPFELVSVLGPQNVNIVLYMTDEGVLTHNRKDLHSIIDLEFSSDRHCKLGPVAQDYLEATQRKFLLKQSSASQPTSGMDTLDEVEDGGSDDETGAELGEGIYMRSGDVVNLGEAESDVTSAITIGGGFAVLQEQATSTIVIQKARRSQRNRLIKSGDSVYFKLLLKKGTNIETRYLTTHHGWWLKWATKFPSKNGYFTIHALDLNPSVRSGETESDYLTMGSSFTLKHKRWSRYHVGVSAEPSPTYGGRMLSLYNPAKSQDKPSADDQYIPDDEDHSDDELELDKKTPTEWSKLVLCAQEPPTPPAPKLALSPGRSPTRDEELNNSADILPIDKLVFSEDHCHVDVPAWIETMNRTERIRQLTYVVRITHSEGADASGEFTDDTTKTFARLRTGRELARIMMVGKSSAAVTTPATSSIQVSYHKRKAFDVEFRDDVSVEEDDTSMDDDIDDEEYAEDVELKLNGSQDEVEILEAVSESDDDLEDEEELEEDSTAQPSQKTGKVAAGKRLIGKVAKTTKSAAKSTVVGTGKLAVKSAVGTGKLAVGTGKLAAKTAVGTGKLAVGTGKLAAKTVYGTTKAAVGTGKYVAKGTLTAGKMAGQAVIAPIKKRKQPTSEPKVKKIQDAKGARLELSAKTM